MAERPGSTPGGNFILHEAECSDGSSDGEGCVEMSDEGFDFIDDASTHSAQSEHLVLYTCQTRRADSEQLQLLKRKYASPSPSPSSKQKVNIDCDLSPRLAAITLSHERKAKRRLFDACPDSGYGHTLEAEVEKGMEDRSNGQVESCGEEMAGSGSNANNRNAAMPIQLLKAKNGDLTKLAKFKEVFSVGFTDLTRPFKSSKTCNFEWVAAVFGVHESVCESVIELLKQQCEYIHQQTEQSSWGNVLLLLLCFRKEKNRGTVEKLLCSVLACNAQLLLTNPPKVRSTAAALYWYKACFTKHAVQWGAKPKWMLQQVALQHIATENIPFDLSTMIQWAYDNGYDDECEVAYEYARLGDTDSNAAAFLKSNCQAKYVKDCVTMVRLYRRAEMKAMNMRQWIEKRTNEVNGEGTWRAIVAFLKYQHVEFVPFMAKFKLFLKGIPKKNCMVFYGPPNTGKSAFCMGLLKFLQGKVISYLNSKSQFWIQPLQDAKLGLLDDATDACWDFMDTYMRNALDGNPISLDRKHKAPIQIKCPPLLVTTNVNILLNDRWKYLHSRVSMVHFPNEFPLTEGGDVVYELTEQNWKSFFGRCWARLSGSDDEDEGDDGDPREPFRCTARQDDGYL
ncbi:E1 [Ailuropoda melanoleuca papillomavirus 2]|uniref:Replication protein E1 n=1 Tax=Ailuropoda melanoleuca papillomavirus 2 TaxID=2016455 RepID=A0A220IGF1_9PAPI|nr:E1 [Ailuropoda melanoleuca papillomavirus 2]ASH99058.1 E1 [Ailuropoda melanoleuca papillomavirus 2]